MTPDETKLIDAAAKALIVIDMMEHLRVNGWCVTLQCVPSAVNKVPWVAGAFNPHTQGRAQFQADTPYDAMRLVAEKVRAEA